MVLWVCTSPDDLCLEQLFAKTAAAPLSDSYMKLELDVMAFSLLLFIDLSLINNMLT